MVIGDYLTHTMNRNEKVGGVGGRIVSVWILPLKIRRSPPKPCINDIFFPNSTDIVEVTLGSILRFVYEPLPPRKVLMYDCKQS